MKRIFSSFTIAVKRKEKSMGRKRIFSKLLLYAAMLSAIGAGVFGSVLLSVKAAVQEETGGKDRGRWL